MRPIKLTIAGFGPYGKALLHQVLLMGDLTPCSEVRGYERLRITVVDKKRDERLKFLDIVIKEIETELKREGIENYFNKIVISEEVGERKPNLKIYLKAFEDIPKEEYEKIIFVSDEILEDLLGVKILGVKTVWYEQTIINKWKKKEEILIEPDYKIKSIKELLDIV